MSINDVTHLGGIGNALLGLKVFSVYKYVCGCKVCLCNFKSIFYFAHFPPGISNSIHSFSWQRDNMSKAKGTVEIHYSLSFLESMCKVELRSFFR